MSFNVIPEVENKEKNKDDTSPNVDGSVSKTVICAFLLKVTEYCSRGY